MRGGAAALLALAACEPLPPGADLRLGARTYSFAEAAVASGLIALSRDIDPNITARIEFRGSGTGAYPHDPSDPDCAPCTTLFELRRGGAVIATSFVAGREAELRVELTVTASGAAGFAADVSGRVLVTDPGASDDGQVVSLSGFVNAP
jgi:hypothetical protein